MSNIRETTLHLLQEGTGKTLDLRLEQNLTPPTVIELKPETTNTYLCDLTEGTVVDWGDGTKSVVTANEAAERAYHTYAATATAPRVVTIDGVIDRGERPIGSAFDKNALIAVRSLGELTGEVGCLFSNCSSLTEIPEGLFDRCKEVTDFSICFSYCSSLTAIPAGLFDHCKEVTSFDSCFSNCSSLTEIPEGLFDRCKEVTDFSVCFSYCSSLTAIPAGLFDNCTAVTTFSQCFSNCRSLTEIPEGLFDHCTAVTDFSVCFSNCSSLTEIPEALFDHCKEVTDFGSCFSYCSSLTSTPAGLFDHCKEVTSFNSCFSNCSSLTRESPSTLVDGKKIRLWERSPENGFAKPIYASSCFKNCKGLSDYAEIPNYWRF